MKGKVTSIEIEVFFTDGSHRTFYQVERWDYADGGLMIAHTTSDKFGVARFFAPGQFRGFNVITRTDGEGA